MSTIYILGRQAALGLAELESLYGGANVRQAGSQSALVQLDGELAFARLGGSVKAGETLATLDTVDWKKLEGPLIRLAPQFVPASGKGKLTIGISAYGLDTSGGKLNAAGLSIKKAVRKATGRSVRLVPNNALELSSAQVYHNNLAGDKGLELLLVADGKTTIVARTTAVQDIDSYTLRDRGRPKRDARVGMLPPKLAQIIINLAAGDQTPSNDLTILDPFCGTGVVLQEAALMGFSAFGSDLEQRMIDYTSTNIMEWLPQQYPHVHEVARGFEKGDATTMQWQDSLFLPDSHGEATDVRRIPLGIGAVAGETYLVRPFTAPPAPDVLAKTVSEVDLILKKFLRNIHDQLSPGTRLCLAVPAWQTGPNQFKHLPLIDQISELGYNRVSFEHVRDDQLLYYREDQIVARQLLVLTRN